MFFSHSFRRSDFTYGITKDHNVKSLLCKKTFRRSEFTYGVTKDQNVESLFKCYFRRSDRRSSDQLKRHFRRSDFDVLIAFINLFDVVMVCMVFGVLFGFRRSDFRSSDHSPYSEYASLFRKQLVAYQYIL